MEVKITKLKDWDLVKTTALATIGKKYTGKEITDKWKRQMLLAKHSPIRQLEFMVEMIGIPSWCSVHFCRHVHASHYVTTQRDDRINDGVTRDDKSQTAPVNHTMIVSAEELMTMSEKRLCAQASPETRLIMQLIVNAMKPIEPILYEKMIPRCVAIGFCGEFTPCGFSETERFDTLIKEYRKVE